MNGKAKERLAALQRQRRRERDAGSFSRNKDVERVLGFVQNETLHALTHADAGVARYAGREPTAAGCHGNGPAFVIRSLDRGRARAKIGVELRLGFGGLRVEVQ